MTFNFNPIGIINTALCIIIVLLGSWGYKKDRDKVPLLIGIAFGLFGISHIVTLVGLENALMSFIITVRVLAYLTVVFSLSTAVAKR
ncbi:MAG: hypothetical protein ABID83_04145 [Candidatus Omnitrophota bacterium]